METSKLVKQGMDESRTQATGEVGEAITEQYMGPSAARIANLIPHKVSFEQGWFRTTTAICHGGTSDGLAFRQRPDGNGIDARCHTGSCPYVTVITHLEALIGLPIWTAYEPVSDAADRASQKRRWPRRKLALAGVAALVVAAPLLLGLGAEAALLNLVGLGIGALLVMRFVAGRSNRRVNRGRK